MLCRIGKLYVDLFLASPRPPFLLSCAEESSPTESEIQVLTFATILKLQAAIDNMYRKEKFLLDT